MRRLYVMGLALVFIGFDAGAGDGMLISQKGKVFTPTRIAVTAGDTVRIANDDRVLHHLYVESEDFNFDSGDQQPGDIAEITFAEPGTYEVLCTIHPKMQLTVEVE